MADTEARIGYGSALEIALASDPSTFTYVSEVFNGTPPSDTDDQLDATHWQSPNRTREYIPGLTDSGEASFEMNYTPGSATDRFLMSIKGKKLFARLTFPNGVQCIFTCSRSGYEKDVPNDDKMTATLTLRVSGDPILTEVAAPRNLIEPIISGVAKVGVPLTVDQGAWAGALEIAYQWKVDGVDVVGATGPSFIPVVGQIGDTVTVEVTAANDDFDATVITAPTAEVAA